MNRDFRQLFRRDTTRSRHPNHAGLHRRALTFAAVVLFCAGVCLSCSDDPTVVEVTTQCLAFLQDDGTASGHVVARTGGEPDCTVLEIDLVATDISQIHSAEIQVAYANGLSILTSVEVGPLLLGLEPGGDSVTCAQAQPDYGVYCQLTDDFSNGTVDLAISRTPSSPGTVDAPPGGAVLARLTFLQITTLPDANGPFDFTYGKLLDDGNGGQTNPSTIIDVAADPSTFVGGRMIIQEQ